MSTGVAAGNSRHLVQPSANCKELHGLTGIKTGIIISIVFQGESWSAIAFLRHAYSFIFNAFFLSEMVWCYNMEYTYEISNVFCENTEKINKPTFLPRMVVLVLLFTPLQFNPELRLIFVWSLCGLQYTYSIL